MKSQFDLTKGFVSNKMLKQDVKDLKSRQVQSYKHYYAFIYEPNYNNMIEISV